MDVARKKKGNIYVLRCSSPNPAATMNGEASTYFTALPWNPSNNSKKK
jgi:hypothetical protein